MGVLLCCLSFRHLVLLLAPLQLLCSTQQQATPKTKCDATCVHMSACTGADTVGVVLVHVFPVLRVRECD